MLLKGQGKILGIEHVCIIYMTGEKLKPLKGGDIKMSPHIQCECMKTMIKVVGSGGAWLHYHYGLEGEVLSY